MTVLERERQRESVCVCVRACMCVCEREREREVTVCGAFRMSHPAVSHLSTYVEQFFLSKSTGFINTSTKQDLINTHT